jgi:hypothetical protein
MQDGADDDQFHNDDGMNIEKTVLDFLSDMKCD